MHRHAWLLVLLLLVTSASAQEAKPDPGVQEKKKPEDNASTPPPPQDQPKKDDSKRPAQGTTKEQEVIITGKRPDYQVPNATTATKTDTPIFQTPTSVQVVPEAIIQDQASTRLKDVLNNVSGVNKTLGVTVGLERNIIRGFQNGRMLYDGLPVDAGAPIDPAMFERIEVLKGPASMLYGYIEPGGTVNVIPEKPQEESQVLLSQEVGSWKYLHTTFDVTGAADEDKTLLYRFGVGFTDEESFRDFVDGRRFSSRAALTWRLSKQTSLEASVSYVDYTHTYDEGVAFTRAGNQVADISTFLGEPGLSGTNIHEWLIPVKFEHHFSDEVTLRNTFFFHNWENDLETIRRSAPTNANNTVTRLADFTHFNAWRYQNVTDVLWTFEMGPMKHELLFGFDFQWGRPDDHHLKRATGAQIPAVDIVNPVYGLPPLTFNQNFDIITKVRWEGLYLQDQIILDPEERFRLLLGARYDWVDWTRVQTPNTPVDSDEANFTWRTGLLFHPVPFISLYGSACTSFSPAFGAVSVGNEPLDSETGVQYETGIKFELLDKRVSVGMAVFRIDKNDVIVNDPNNAGFSLNGGTMHSDGFELDAAGELVGGLQVIGNYAYTNTEVVHSNVLIEGARLLNVPRNAGSVWCKYTFLEGPLSELGIGAGVLASDRRSGDDNDTFELPGYAVLSLGLSYRGRLMGSNYKLQFNVQNLLDKLYYDSSLGSSRVQPGSPRAFLFSAELAF